MKAFAHRLPIDAPFRDSAGRAYLERHGIGAASSLLSADLVVTTRLSRAKRLRLLFPWKRFIVWTNEPDYDHTPPDGRRSGILVRNVFSGRVFFHNRHFLQSAYCRLDPQWWPDAAATAVPYDPRAFSFAARPGGRTICFVFKHRLYRGRPVMIGGHDVNLEPVRLRTAHDAWRAGRGHVYGAEWPAAIARPEPAGHPHWWRRKVRLLGGYFFNFALENTAFPYYCTEKIWHAIMAGCLPIYWGRGTAIHETFPRGSFLDLSQFAGSGDLLDRVARMDEREFCDRYNACAEVFNREQERRRRELAAGDQVEFRELVADLRAWLG